MSAAPAAGELRSALTVATLTARRAARSGAVWGLLFGVLIFNEAVTYHTSCPTRGIARGHRAHVRRATPPSRRSSAPPASSTPSTASCRGACSALLVSVGAIWGLLTATRLLRREEDAGRWELLLAGRTTRRRATAQASPDSRPDGCVLWAFSAALTVAAGSRSTVGFSTSGSLLYATAATASAAMFLAIGALTSQLGRDAPAGQRRSPPPSSRPPT